MSKVPYIECDAMLLGWSETHNGGAKLTLQLSDVAELEPFKSMTIKKGKVAGQMLKAVFVEVDGNGEPIGEEPAKKGGGKFPTGYCGLAVKWCGEPSFLRWISEAYPVTWTDYLKVVGTAPLEVAAAWMLKKVCGISSRKELDTNDIARATFEQHIREPYMRYRKELGLE